MGASIARIFLVPDNLDMITEWKNGGPGEYHTERNLATHVNAREMKGIPWPWRLPMLMASTTFVWPPGHQRALKNSHDLSPVPIEMDVKKSPLRPAIIPSAGYQVLVLGGKRLRRAGLNPNGPFEDRLLGDVFLSGLMISSALQARSLVPAEVLAGSCKIMRHCRVLMSDILCADGVWRQPLEIIVDWHSGSDQGNLSNRIITYLSLWLLHAARLRDYTIQPPSGTDNNSFKHVPKAVRISKFNIYHYVDFKFQPRPSGYRPRILRHSANYVDDNSQSVGRGDEIFLRFREYVWTAAKICYMLTSDITNEEVKELVNGVSREGGRQVLTQEEIEAVVDGMVKLGLAGDENTLDENTLDENTLNEMDSGSGTTTK